MTAAARQYANVERVVETRAFSAVDPRGERTGEFVVRAYSILSTDFVVVDVYEPVDGHTSRFTSPEHGQLGMVKARPLSPELAAMPYGDVRTKVVEAVHRAHDALCEEIIRAAFPEITFTASSIGNGHAILTLDEFAAVQV